MTLSFKTTALAGAILLATVGGAFASTYATINYDTAVKDAPKKWADTINYAQGGDDVKVLKCVGNYCYVKLDGPDGWIKKNALDFGGPSYPVYPSYPSSPVQACFWGPGGYICIN